MACWGLIPRFWVKDKGFKEDDAVWGDAKLVGAGAPPPATELRSEKFIYQEVDIDFSQGEGG